MLNEFGPYGNIVDNTAIKQDFRRKEFETERNTYFSNVPEVAAPRQSDLPVPPAWNYNPYLGNFYNYCSNNTYDIAQSGIPHYEVPKHGNHQSALQPSPVLQCCDPRCQLKYPVGNHLTHPSSHSSHKYSKSKRLKSFNLDNRSQDHGNKYVPYIAPESIRPELNKYNGQQPNYGSLYQNPLKPTKHVFLQPETSVGDYYTDIGKPSYWNKQNLWNRNNAPSYYTSSDSKDVNHRVSSPTYDQRNVNQHGILLNRLLDHDKLSHNTGYMPNFSYGKQELNDHRTNEVNSNHINRGLINHDQAYNNYMQLQNNYPYFPFYSHPNSDIVNQNRSTNSFSTGKQTNEKQSNNKILEKNPNLDVREFLSTWDDVEDDKVPENADPVIVLDCTTLEGDALAKVKEKLSENETCNSAETNSNIYSEVNSNSALRAIDDGNKVATSSAGNVSHENFSLITASNSPTNLSTMPSNVSHDGNSDSSHINSDGCLTWYSNSKKKEDLSYDIVEMTERLVNTVDKLFSEPDKHKKASEKASVFSQNSPDRAKDHKELSSENQWNINLNYRKNKSIYENKTAPYTSSSYYSDNNSHFENVNPVSQHDVLMKPTYPSFSSMYYNDHSNDVLNDQKNVSCSFNLKKVNNDLKFSMNYSKHASYSTKLQDYSAKYKDSCMQASHLKTDAPCKYGTKDEFPFRQDFVDCNTQHSFYNTNCQFNDDANKYSNCIGVDKVTAVNYVDHYVKDITNDHVRDIKADLEKSLSEITDQFKYAHQSSLKNRELSGTNFDIFPKLIDTNSTTLPSSSSTDSKNVAENDKNLEKTDKRDHTDNDDGVQAGKVPSVDSNDGKNEFMENTVLSMPSLSPSSPSLYTDSEVSFQSSKNFKEPENNIENGSCPADTTADKSACDNSSTVPDLTQPHHSAVKQDDPLVDKESPDREINEMSYENRDNPASSDNLVKNVSDLETQKHMNSDEQCLTPLQPLDLVLNKEVKEPPQSTSAEDFQDEAVSSDFSQEPNNSIRNESGISGSATKEGSICNVTELDCIKAASPPLTEEQHTDNCGTTFAADFNENKNDENAKDVPIEPEMEIYDDVKSSKEVYSIYFHTKLSKKYDDKFNHRSNGEHLRKLSITNLHSELKSDESSSAQVINEQELNETHEEYNENALDAEFSRLNNIIFSCKDSADSVDEYVEKENLESNWKKSIITEVNKNKEENEFSIPDNQNHSENNFDKSYVVKKKKRKHKKFDNFRKNCETKLTSEEKNENILDVQSKIDVPTKNENIVNLHLDDLLIKNATDCSKLITNTVSVIKENNSAKLRTNCDNRQEDLENIRRCLPKDTLLFKCTVPTDSKCENPKLEENSALDNFTGKDVLLNDPLNDVPLEEHKDSKKRECSTDTVLAKKFKINSPLEETVIDLTNKETEDTSEVQLDSSENAYNKVLTINATNQQEDDVFKKKYKKFKTIMMDKVKLAKKKKKKKKHNGQFSQNTNDRQVEKVCSILENSPIHNQENNDEIMNTFQECCGEDKTADDISKTRSLKIETSNSIGNEEIMNDPPSDKPPICKVEEENQSVIVNGSSITTSSLDTVLEDRHLKIIKRKNTCIQSVSKCLPVLCSAEDKCRKFENPATNRLKSSNGLTSIIENLHNRIKVGSNKTKNETKCENPTEFGSNASHVEELSNSMIVNDSHFPKRSDIPEVGPIECKILSDKIKYVPREEVVDNNHESDIEDFSNPEAEKSDLIQQNIAYTTLLQKNELDTIPEAKSPITENNEYYADECDMKINESRQSFDSPKNMKEFKENCYNEELKSTTPVLEYDSEDEGISENYNSEEFHSYTEDKEACVYDSYKFNNEIRENEVKFSPDNSHAAQHFETDDFFEESMSGKPTTTVKPFDNEINYSQLSDSDEDKDNSEDEILSIPSVAPTPHCDFYRDDVDELPSTQKYTKPFLDDEVFTMPSTKFNKRIIRNNHDIDHLIYHAPTPNCDFIKHGLIDTDDEDYSDANEKQETFEQKKYYSDDYLTQDFSNDTKFYDETNKAPSPNCPLNELSDDIFLNKAPSPDCILNEHSAHDFADDEEMMTSPSQSSDNIENSSISSKAPSPNCDYVINSIHNDDKEEICQTDFLDKQENDIESENCLDGHHTDGIPDILSLRSLAMNALLEKGFSSLYQNDKNNFLEVWLTPDKTEIIIHPEQVKMDELMDVVPEISNNLIISSASFDDESVEISPNFDSSKEFDFTVDVVSQNNEDVSSDDIQCQCLIISNEEAIVCLRCSLSSSVHSNDTVYSSDVNKPQYVEGIGDLDEMYPDYKGQNPNSSDCIEESFIDQNVKFSPDPDTSGKIFTKRCSSPLSPMSTSSSSSSSSSSSFSASSISSSSSDSESDDDVTDIEENEYDNTYVQPDCSAIENNKILIKVKLPWDRIFDLSDKDADSKSVKQKKIELGPAKVEIRLSQDQSGVWKVINPEENCTSPIVKIKRLILQTASDLNSSQSNIVLKEDFKENCNDQQEHDMDIYENSIAEYDYTSQNLLGDEETMSNGMKADVDEVRLPKMVIKKTSPREYTSYLQHNSMKQPIIKLFRSKSLDDMALKYQNEEIGCKQTQSVTLENSLESTTPEIVVESETCDENQAAAEEKLHTPENNDIKEDEDSPGKKFRREAHHCLLCHRTYPTLELHRMHLKGQLHRHVELVQRKTVHAMYRYFAGRYCPRLKPLSAKERKLMKWKPRDPNKDNFYHGKTPLQIALHKNPVYIQKKCEQPRVASNRSHQLTTETGIEKGDAMLYDDVDFSMVDEKDSFGVLPSNSPMRKAQTESSSKSPTSYDADVTKRSLNVKNKYDLDKSYKYDVTNNVSFISPLKRGSNEMEYFASKKQQSEDMSEPMTFVAESDSKWNIQIENKMDEESSYGFGSYEKTDQVQDMFVDFQNVEKADDEMASDFQTRTASTYSEKLAVLEDRDKFIRKLEGKGEKNDLKPVLKGTCPDMCPEKERLLREVNCSFSIFEGEVVHNEMHVVPERLVKEYSRSSADQDQPLPHELRPQPVLLNTMNYLVTNIIPKIDDDQTDIAEWYHFCWDRLRSIRKDIIQQQLRGREIVTILEESARFHICCSDLLHGSERRIFDEKINAENLANCLQMLIGMYDELATIGVECENETEFRIYMMLLQLDSADLPSVVKDRDCFDEATKDAIQNARDIYFAFKLRLYKQFFKLVRKTSYLNACILQRYFSAVRSQALNTITNTYSSGNQKSKFPLSFIKNVLEFEFDEDAMWFVESHGFVANHANELSCSKAEFSVPDVNFSQKSTWIVKEKRVPILKAVTVTGETKPFVLSKVHNSFDEQDVLQEKAWKALDQKEKIIELYGDIYQDVDDNPVVESLMEENPKDSISTSSHIDASFSFNLSNLDADKEKDGKTSLFSFGKLASLAPQITSLFSNVYNKSSDGETQADDLEINTESSIQTMDGGSKSNPEIKIVENTEPHNVSVPYTKTVPSPSKKQKSFVFDAKPSLLDKLPEKHDSDLAEKFPPIDKDKTQSMLFKALTAPLVKKKPSLEQPKVVQGILKSPHCATEMVTNVLKSVKTKHQPKVERSETLVSAEALLKTINEQLSQLNERYASIQKGNLVKQKLIKQKMKRDNVKKYARLWKNKVENIKSSYENYNTVSHISLDNYLQLWGTRDRIPTNIVREHQEQIKMMKMCSNLLAGDTLNIKYFGDKLARIIFNRVQKRRPLDVICWKVLLLLPDIEHPEVASFSLKVREVCQLLYYNGKQLGDVETTVVSNIKVHTSIDLQHRAQKENLLGVMQLVVFVSEAWEDCEQFEQRIRSIMSAITNPVFMNVICINELTFEQKILRWAKAFKKQNLITGWRICKWNNFFVIPKVIADSQLVPPIKPFRYQSLTRFVIAASSDFFVSVQHLWTAEIDNSPLAYIKLYNQFVEKLADLVSSYSLERFNLAREHVLAVSEKRASNLLDTNILSMMLDYNLISFTKWPPKNCAKLVKLLRKYCETIDESGLLFPNVLRLVNPEREVDVKTVSDRAPWVEIVELWSKYNTYSVSERNSTDVLIFYDELEVAEITKALWIC